MKRVSDSRLGTPVDLKEAIARGISEIAELDVLRDDPLVKRFHDIVQDRLSQSFSTAMCSAKEPNEIMDLWYSIFPKKRGH